jgi:hypothetical protein
MRADYDSEGNTLALDLIEVERLDYGDDSAHPQAVASFCDGQLAAIDVIGAKDGVEVPLAAVAATYDLDLEALLAAARAAFAAPDRTIVLDVLSRVQPEGYSPRSPVA